MQTPEALKSQIDSTEDLQSVVKTMKAQAAVSIQQYEAAIESLRQYSHTIELGLQIALRQPVYSRPTNLWERRSNRADQLGVILFGSDQGLCGQFNQQIAQHLHRYITHPPMPTKGTPQVAVVGARPLPPLQELGIEIGDIFSVPTNVEGITAAVQDLLLLINRWREEDSLDRILLFYNRPISSASYESITMQLLPLDRDWLSHLQQRPWESHRLPAVLMDTEKLFSKLVQQYLFIALYQALAASLTSENASRLAAMQSAESNIDERLEDLTSQYRQQRQSAITAELLDVVSGFEALTGQ